MMGKRRELRADREWHIVVCSLSWTDNRFHNLFRTLPDEVPSGGPVVLDEALYDIKAVAVCPYSVGFSPDGDTLLVSYAGDDTRLFDMNSGEELLTINSPAGNLPAQFSPDGRHVAIGELDGAVRVHTLDEAELLELARSKITRSLTEEECRQYLYLDTCPADS